MLYAFPRPPHAPLRDVHTFVDDLVGCAQVSERKEKERPKEGKLNPRLINLRRGRKGIRWRTFCCHISRVKGDGKSFWVDFAAVSDAAAREACGDRMLVMLECALRDRNFQKYSYC